MNVLGEGYTVFHLASPFGQRRLTAKSCCKTPFQINNPRIESAHLAVKEVLDSRISIAKAVQGERERPKARYKGAEMPGYSGLRNLIRLTV